MRSCATCQRFIMGENGEVSESFQPGPDGQPVWGPTPAPDNWRPPCGVCPKVAHLAVKAPLIDEDDLFAADWFWELRQWFRECRAVGTFDGPDPLLRACAAELDAADRRQSSRSADLTAAFLAQLTRRR